jgi:E3 ubiquitin-protein ligase RNF115/126
MDDFITHLMEQGQGSTAPPPATNQTMESLPRFKVDKALADGGKECTVCKEGFHINEDAIRLPCTHELYIIPFLKLIFSHEDCILPWLKINGSCPVCRHTLNGSSEDTQGSSSNNTRSPPNDTRSASSSTSSRQQQPEGSSGSSWPFLNFFNIGSGNGGTSRGSGNPGTSAPGGSGGGDQSWRGRHNSMPPEEDLD